MIPEDAAEVTHEINTKLRGQAARDLFRRILGQPDATEEGLKDVGQRLTALELGVNQLVQKPEAEATLSHLQALDRRLDRLELVMDRVLRLLEDPSAERDAADTRGIEPAIIQPAIAPASTAADPMHQPAQARHIGMLASSGDQSSNEPKRDAAESEVNGKVRILHVVGGALLFVFAAVGGAFLWRS